MSEKRRDSKGRLLKDNESQRPDGRYQFRYTDASGNRITLYSWRLVESDPHPSGRKRDISLREKEVAIQKDKYDGIDSNKGNMIVNRLFDTFMVMKKTLQHTTRRNYESLYNAHVRESSFGNKKVSTVKKSDVMQLYDTLEKEGLSNGTIQALHMILGAMFQVAVEDDCIRKNPCTGCSKEYPYSAYDKRKSLTVRQQQIFLNFLEEDKVYSKYVLITKLILCTGLRCGEAIGLTWDEIDWKTKTINVQHQLQYNKVNGEYRFVIGKPKTISSVRTIPMTSEIFSLLQELRQVTYFKSINSKVKVDGHKGFLFLNRNGDTPIIPRQYSDSLEQAVRKYNKKEAKTAIKEDREPELLPEISAHVLRHTACTRMAEAGMDVKVLQKIMGHSRAEITMNVYNHADFTRIASGFNRVEGALLLG